MTQKVLERILVTKENFYEIESEIRFHEHLRRYAAIRRFCYGKVLDFASGCGYGSFLISANPDVEHVVGVDKDSNAIEWANREFNSEKTTFLCQDIEDMTGQFDTLVSLEAIEHFADQTILPRLAKRCTIDNLIISFPNKKSTHFNPFHVYDYTIQDVVDLFADYLCYHTFVMGDVQFLLFIRKPAKAPFHLFRTLHEIG